MASKRALRRKQCDGKHVYPDEATATRYARQRSAAAGAWILPYRCSFGNHWHIGHPPHRRGSPNRRKG